MCSTSPLILRLLASSITVAERAGKIVRDVMSKGELGIVEKAKNDFQTEADRSAQKCIIASLSAQFPLAKIIGEEDSSDNDELPRECLVLQGDEEILNLPCPPELEDIKEEDVVIWVDPLDGTSEYTQGFLEHVTVLIGISVNEKAVAGVIHQPYYKGTDRTGRSLWGLNGLGVGGFVPKPEPFSLIITTTRSHSNPLVESALQVMNASQVLRVGGAGFKVIQLLEGKASLYVFASNGCKKWDTCGPEAVLEAAGGVLTNMLGEHYSYGADQPRPNAQGVLAAANLPRHAEALSKIPQQLKDELLKN